MKKNIAGKLLGGAAIGAALGVAAGLLLAPESGKGLRRDIKKRSAEFYAHLSPRLKKVQRMGEGQYKAFVKDAAKNFSKAKRLSKAEEKMIVANAHKSWKHLKKHLAK